MDIKNFKNYDSKDLRPNLQRLGYFQEEDWEKTGIIEVKPENTYQTSRSNSVWGWQNHVTDTSKAVVPSKAQQF